MRHVDDIDEVFEPLSSHNLTRTCVRAIDRRKQFRPARSAPVVKFKVVREI